MICAIGNINIDWICMLPHLPAPDEKVNIRELNIFPGGAASNFSVSLARLGSDVAIFGHVGDDAEGREALKALKKEGVNTSRVILEKDQITGFVLILVGKEGQTMKIRYRGANSLLSSNDITPKLLKDVEIAYVASVSIPIAKQVARTCAEIGARSAIDIGEEISTELLDDIRDMISNFSIVFMNQVVFKRIFNQRPTLKNAHSEIDGNMEVLSITMGRKGSITTTTDKVFKTPAYKVEAVDTTGAGDAFAAGFIHYYHQQFPIEEVVKRATACSALQITAPGGRAGLPTAEEIERFIKMSKK